MDEAGIRLRYEAVRDQLDERGKRRFAAAEVRAAGYGGVVAVSRATGSARSTIGRVLKELGRSGPPAGRIRRAGSGRHTRIRDDAALLDDLRHLVEPLTLGDPMRPLLWVSKSRAKPAAALRAMGHQIGCSAIPLGAAGFPTPAAPVRR